MLDMGFFDDIAKRRAAVPEGAPDAAVLRHLPRGHRQARARSSCASPQQIDGARRSTTAGKIRQRLYEVKDERAPARRGPAAEPLPAGRARWPSATPSSSAATWSQVLQAQGFSALALHGDLEQRERDQVLVQFANRSCSVLVATDVAARGLDIAQLEAVINVDVTPDAEVHIHRIGRTGRAGDDRPGAQPGQPGRDGPRRPHRAVAGPRMRLASAGRADAAPSEPSRCSRRWPRCRSSAAARRRSAPATCWAR